MKNEIFDELIKNYVKNEEENLNKTAIAIPDLWVDLIKGNDVDKIKNAANILISNKEKLSLSDEKIISLKNKAELWPDIPSHQHKYINSMIIQGLITPPSAWSDCYKENMKEVLENIPSPEFKIHFEILFSLLENKLKSQRLKGETYLSHLIFPTDLSGFEIQEGLTHFRMVNDFIYKLWPTYHGLLVLITLGENAYLTPYNILFDILANPLIKKYYWSLYQDYAVGILKECQKYYKFLHWETALLIQDIIDCDTYYRQPDNVKLTLLYCKILHDIDCDKIIDRFERLDANKKIAVIDNLIREDIDQYVGNFIFRLLKSTVNNDDLNRKLLAWLKMDDKKIPSVFHLIITEGDMQLQKIFMKVGNVFYNRKSLLKYFIGEYHKDLSDSTIEKYKAFLKMIGYQYFINELFCDGNIILYHPLLKDFIELIDGTPEGENIKAEFCKFADSIYDMIETEISSDHFNAISGDMFFAHLKDKNNIIDYIAFVHGGHPDQINGKLSQAPASCILLWAFQGYDSIIVPYVKSLTTSEKIALLEHPLSQGKVLAGLTFKKYETILENLLIIFPESSREKLLSLIPKNVQDYEYFLYQSVNKFLSLILSSYGIELFYELGLPNLIDTRIPFLIKKCWPYFRMMLSAFEGENDKNFQLFFKRTHDVLAASLNIDKNFERIVEIAQCLTLNRTSAFFYLIQEIIVQCDDKKALIDAIISLDLIKAENPQSKEDKKNTIQNLCALICKYLPADLHQQYLSIFTTDFQKECLIELADTHESLKHLRYKMHKLTIFSSKFFVELEFTDEFTQELLDYVNRLTDFNDYRFLIKCITTNNFAPFDISYKVINAIIEKMGIDQFVNIEKVFFFNHYLPAVNQHRPEIEFKRILTRLNFSLKFMELHGNLMNVNQTYKKFCTYQFKQIFYTALKGSFLCLRDLNVNYKTIERYNFMSLGFIVETMGLKGLCLIANNPSAHLTLDELVTNENAQRIFSLFLVFSKRCIKFFEDYAKLQAENRDLISILRTLLKGFIPNSEKLRFMPKDDLTQQIKPILEIDDPQEFFKLVEKLHSTKRSSTADLIKQFFSELELEAFYHSVVNESKSDVPTSCRTQRDIS